MQAACLQALRRYSGHKTADLLSATAENSSAVMGAGFLEHMGASLKQMGSAHVLHQLSGRVKNSLEFTVGFVTQKVHKRLGSGKVSSRVGWGPHGLELTELT